MRTTETEASAAYREERDKVRVLMNELHERLAMLDAQQRQKRNQKNWCYAGTAAHIEESLNTLLEGLR